VTLLTFDALTKTVKWVSKNFVLQGLVFFRAQGLPMVFRGPEKRRDAVGRTFCVAITLQTLLKQRESLFSIKF